VNRHAPGGVDAGQPPAVRQRLLSSAGEGSMVRQVDLLPALLTTASGAAIFAGFAAVGVTLAVERFGGRIGGLVGTLPTTIVPASIGMAIESPDIDAFRSAMYATPVGMLVNALFLACWRVLPPRLSANRPVHIRLGTMLALSLVVWSGAALAAISTIGQVESHVGAASSPWVGAFGMFGLVFLGFLFCLGAPPSPRGSRPVSLAALVGRGALAGLAVGLSTVVAAAGSPTVAAMAAIFPAIFITTMVSVWLAQGEAVQLGAVGPMMLGSTAVAGYALFAAWMLPAFGIAFGALLAWLGAGLCCTVPAWGVLRLLSSRTPRERRAG